MSMTDQQIQQWIEDHGGGTQGLDKLEEAFRHERFSDTNARDVGAFLNSRRERAAAERRAKDQGLAERGVVAAETQAEVAKQALERSNIAIAISVVAGLVAIVDLLVRH